MKEKLLRKMLEDNMFKVTKGRLLVFRMLYSKNEPQTMASLVAASSGRLDRVSIYRIIELYEKLGIVKRINIGWKYKLELSDLFLDHHHHISCLGCGCMVAIEVDDDIEKLMKKLGDASRFSQVSHQLELQGYCPDCQNGASTQKVSLPGSK